MEINNDGSETLCFLRWLDERNDTEHHSFYTTHGWWPSVPSVSVRTGLPEHVPEPAVSYPYFLNMLNRYQFGYKDLTTDQCGSCNKYRGELRSAGPNSK
jgi:hypothetical protein